MYIYVKYFVYNDSCAATVYTIYRLVDCIVIVVHTSFDYLGDHKMQHGKQIHDSIIKN